MAIASIKRWSSAGRSDSLVAFPSGVSVEVNRTVLRRRNSHLLFAQIMANSRHVRSAQPDCLTVQD